MLLVLQLRITASVEIHEIFARDGRMRAVPNRLHGIQLHLVCHQVQRLRLWQPSNILDVLLAESLLLLRRLKEGYLWRVVVLTELLLSLYIYTKRSDIKAVGIDGRRQTIQTR